MGFAAHLKELRNRVTISLIVIAAFSIGGFFLADFVLELLARPLDVLEARGYEVNINITMVTQAFNLKMLIGLLLGVVAASPFWLYQMLAFFLPGLKKRERRYLLGFIIASVPLFFLGCATGWIILPRIITIFVGFAPMSMTQLLSAQEYFMFSLRLVFACGCAFLMPVILVMLNFANMLTAKSILKGWRWAVILITIFAAMMTPAGEIISMFILAVPILVLYFAAALIAWLNDRRRAKRLAKQEREEAV
ncbi:MAG TPA: twin-arginine translocase subunit TatC [Candidatus Agrococcus pullicola]|uniref:Sec-independent protein translocase protein TatC n=1 Tax=Candidatus Agrococcus pullicola TaxID=2838429 RepID=A0A9D1YYC3_9MICO|nr:twin-arginine translocase subunit TatC [Candidatus Agrococcus pullicola]